MTTVRVLQTCSLGNVNDVVEVDANALAEHVAHGYADPDPAAVAYAQGLPAAAAAAAKAAAAVKLGS
jgi:hypothetical protein